jgi:uncharacterized cupin superfamily protein
MTAAQTQQIQIQRQPSPEQLSRLGVFGWSIWTKEVSEFPWTYDAAETCYFLEGEVAVTPAGGVPVEMGQGDLVTFPAGMSCTWQIRRPVKKHYQFG